VEAVERGDPQARAVWAASIQALAAAVASIVNILDPEAVVIGGGIARAGATLFGPLADRLAVMEWRPGGHRVTILPAELGEWAGAYGAARHAIDRSP
jgi:glucokinase